MTEVQGNSGDASSQSSARHFWLVLSVMGAVLGLAKGIRLPNDWSATQAQVDYRFGIVKRGLFGTLFTDHLGLWQYTRFAKFSLVVFAVVCVLFVLFLRQSGVFLRMGSGEPAALLLCSFVVPCVANLLGYFDILLLGITLSLLLIRDARVRFWIAVPLSLVALLVHESYLLMFLPVVVCSFLFDVERVEASGRRPVFAAVLGAVCVSFTFWLAWHARLTSAQVQTMSQQILQKVDFPIRRDFFIVMTSSLKENGVNSLRYFFNRDFRILNIESPLIFFPVLCLMMVYGWNVCRGAVNTRVRDWGFACMTVVVLAAYSMHLIGVDVFRFDAWTCFAAFLVLLLLVRAQPKVHVFVSDRMRYATLLVIVLSANAGVGTMDMSPRRYPFVTDGDSLHLQVKDHLFWYPPTQ
jgi:hypothetical protein